MTVLPTTHNIRRPAFWLLSACVGAIAFFLLTDPRAGLVKYSGDTAVDAVNKAETGTIVGLAGSVILLAIAMFLCTRKGSPRTK
jgi:hypothetical protein